MSASSPNDLIMDIPVELSVELGRTQVQVKEVMAMAPGTVIELERKPNEPVDLYVNGRLVARGEVVVMETNLGIKITELISQKAV